MCKTVGDGLPHKEHFASTRNFGTLHINRVGSVSEPAHRIKESWLAGRPSIFLFHTLFWDSNSHTCLNFPQFSVVPTKYSCSLPFQWVFTASSEIFLHSIAKVLCGIDSIDSQAYLTKESTGTDWTGCLLIKKISVSSKIMGSSEDITDERKVRRLFLSFVFCLTYKVWCEGTGHVCPTPLRDEGRGWHLQ